MSFISDIVEFYIEYQTTIKAVIVGQGILLILLILGGPRGKRLPGYLIVAFIGIQSNYMIMVSLPWRNVYYLSLTYSTLFALGPLFYFYCKSLILDHLVFQWTTLIHVLPALTIWLVLLGYGGGANAEELLLYGVNYVHLNFLSLMIYIGLSLRMLSGYAQYIEGRFSLLDNISREWLSRIAMLYFTISAIMFTAFTVRIIVGNGYAQIGALMRLWTFAQFLLIAFVGCRSQLQLFDHIVYVHKEKEDAHPIINQDVFSDTKNTTKYGAAKLDDCVMQVIWREINDAMTQHELFLDQSLHIQKLADTLSLSRNDVSQVINSTTGQNFHDFVNNYRAQKARKLIEVTARTNKAMLDIALEAGFSNSVTFNKYFKKLFSMTPIKYKKYYLERTNHNVA